MFSHFTTSVFPSPNPHYLLHFISLFFSIFCSEYSPLVIITCSPSCCSNYEIYISTSLSLTLTSVTHSERQSLKSDQDRTWVGQGLSNKIPYLIWYLIVSIVPSLTHDIYSNGCTDGAG